jgi:hypothetical protein
LDKGAVGSDQDGCQGAGCAGDGGDGANLEGDSAEPGTNGCSGQPGVSGEIILLQDCNCNDVTDEHDIAGSTSDDCQLNDIPDECDLDRDTSEDCDVSFVPDECEALADCQPNGTPDVCELLFVNRSRELTPVDGASPQSHTIPHPPEAVSDVTLLFTAVADLDFSTELIDVYLNGQHMGSVFVFGAGHCPAIRDVDMLSIPAEDFNTIVNSTDAVIDMVASNPVGPDCLYSCITVTTTYTTERNDCNGNLVPDDCDIAEGTSTDCQPNTVPDECDLAVDGEYRYDTDTLTTFNV